MSELTEKEIKEYLHQVPQKNENAPRTLSATSLKIKQMEQIKVTIALLAGMTFDQIKHDHNLSIVMTGLSKLNNGERHCLQHLLAKALFDIKKEIRDC